MLKNKLRPVFYLNTRTNAKTLLHKLSSPGVVEKEKLLSDSRPFIEVVEREPEPQSRQRTLMKRN